MATQGSVCFCTCRDRWNTDTQCISGQTVIDCHEVLDGVINTDKSITEDQEDAVKAEDALQESSPTSTADATGTALVNPHAQSK